LADCPNLNVLIVRASLLIFCGSVRYSMVLCCLHCAVRISSTKCYFFS